MRLLMLALAAGLAAPAWAQKIDSIQLLNQGQFRLLSEDLGGALSYRAQTTTEPLGTTGFDVGFALTAARLKNTGVLELATSDSAPSTLLIPTLRAHKGLPLGFDVGVMYAQIPGSNIKYYGGELRYAIVQGGVAMPAIGVRGNFTKVTGVDQIDFDTRGLDLSISKGFTFATPYAGIGRVWVNSDPKGNGGRAKEDFGLNKYFVGVGFKLQRRRRFGELVHLDHHLRHRAEPGEKRVFHQQAKEGARTPDRPILPLVFASNRADEQLMKRP